MIPAAGVVVVMKNTANDGINFSLDNYQEAAGVWSNAEVALPGDPPGNLDAPL